MAKLPVSASELSSNSTYESGLLGNVYVGGGIGGLDHALALIDGDPAASFVSTELDYRSTGGSLVTFLGDDADSLDDPRGHHLYDQYALSFSGQIYLEAGSHRFRNTTDDGFRLTVADQVVAEYADPRSSGTTRGELNVSESGWYSIQIDYYEAWGVSELNIRHSANGDSWATLDSSLLRHSIDDDAGETPVDPVDPPAENTAPEARDNGRSIWEDGHTTLRPLSNDRDADGDELFITRVENGAHGTVTLNDDGSVTYVADPDFFGEDRFEYEISDGRGGYSTAGVNVTVRPVNDAPDARNDDGIVATQGEVLYISIADLLANDLDVDGDALSITELFDVTNGTAEIVGDRIRFVSDETGDASFQYRLSDGQGEEDQALVSISVQADGGTGPVENTRPDARDDTRSMTEDGSLRVAALENDVVADGDALTISSVEQAANGTVTLNDDGTISYVPNANFNGTDSFLYEVTDEHGATDTARVTVNVAAQNDAPEAVNDSGFTVTNGNMLMIDIADLLANDSDIDGDALSISNLSNVSNGSAMIVGDQIHFTADGEGAGGFSYTLSDGNGGQDQANVSINIGASDNGSGDGADGGHHGGGSGDLIDPPQTPQEIAEFVEMVRNMPEHEMDGHEAGMANHMATLDLVPRQEATHIAINHGDWNDASTWHNGEIPGEGARVLIPEGISVGYSEENDSSIFTLRVDGVLHFATDQDSRLVVDTIVVSPTGQFNIGSEHDPVEAGTNVDIVFADNGNIDVNWDPALLSRGMVAMGEVNIHGQEKTSHLKVETDAMAGDTTLSLEEIPTGWQVGDKLVLTGTYQQGFYWNNDIQGMDFAESQDEEVYITAINGTTITLDRPLTYDHDTPRDDLKAYVANMTRNVTFSSEAGEDTPVHQRGHVMFMHNDDVDVRYATFADMGRTDKSEFAGSADDFGGVGNLSPDANVEARYPFHFHEAGVTDLENPAIALGNVVDGSPGWGYVHHSSNADLTSNVAFDVWGAAFVAEDGNETGTWYNNIAIKSQGWAASDVAVKNSEVDGNDARTGDGFWFAGRLVEVVGNVAANTTHGFVWLHRGERDSVDPDTLHQSELGYGRDSLGNDKAPIQTFRDNEAFGTNTGLIVVKENPDQGHDVRSVFDGFLNWETREGVAVSYTGHYTFLDFDLIGQRPEDSEVWDYAYQGVKLGTNAFDMVFNNISIDGFDHAFNLTDNTNVNTGRPGNFHNTVIDGDFVNIRQGDIAQIADGQLAFLRGSDLTEGRLEFDLTADRYISDSDHLFFDGIKTDSIGSVERSFEIEQQGLWGWHKEGYLNSNGYWRLPDGTPVLLIEDYIADRATGELAKQMLVFELDYSDGVLQSRYPYNGEINLGGPAAEARDDIGMTTESTNLLIDLVANDSDPDGGDVYVDGMTDPLNGSVYLQDDGMVLYRPNQGFTGTDRFFYWAADEEGNFSRAEAVIHVTASSHDMHGAMESDTFQF
ncbi:Ig-like domain-containing protein [Paracoccus sp. Z330]|uniref:Ig-like domain-containing protein n=1 Tax=Paracoccus onchidii TaxID=3017813 RepID=A0ABT4ZE88_9RHOB|nr:Ig-like domain-containing protein [Paracoccus onchidii]MDB6177046.1 Ig-like domain-containing protein [Paracoccus onchidii]